MQGSDFPSVRRSTFYPQSKKVRKAKEAIGRSLETFLSDDDNNDSRCGEEYSRGSRIEIAVGVKKGGGNSCVSKNSKKNVKINS